MKWNEVKVTTESEAIEAVSNILMEAGASGVMIEDSLDIENYKTDAYGELLDKENYEMITEGAIVTAYFPETTFLPEIMPTIQARIAQLVEFGLAIGKNEVEISEVSEENWATAWKKYYHPVQISRFLTIVPSWQEYHATHPEEKIITLDPGMAFGTGTHPTTRLTLQALEVTLHGDETVLDVGTGSGVLSIASSLLGAKEIFAYDLDDVAVRVAQENIDMNPNMENIHVAAGDLLKGVDIQADVIVANILADILIHLTDDAYRLVKDEGYLIMSGIIADKLDMVLEAAYSAGFFLETHMIQGEWNALVLKKTDDISGVIGG